MVLKYEISLLLIWSTLLKIFGVLEMLKAAAIFRGSLRSSRTSSTFQYGRNVRKFSSGMPHLKLSRGATLAIYTLSGGLLIGTLLPLGYMYIKENVLDEKHTYKHSKPQSKMTDFVFLDFTAKSQYLGRVVIGLYGEDAPLSVKNFIGLCNGYQRSDENLSENEIKYLHYKDTSIFEAFPGLCLVMGDILTNTGDMGMSIYGSNFEEDTSQFSHSGLGVVGMMNQNGNGNDSRFWISMRPFPHLDGKSTIFGHVVQGEDTLLKLEKLPASSVYISDCGILSEFQYHEEE